MNTIRNADLRGSFLRRLGIGAAAGFAGGLLFLAAAEGLTGTALSAPDSLRILFLSSGWTGIFWYARALRKAFLADG